MAAPMTGSPFWSTTRPDRDDVVTCAKETTPANKAMLASKKLLKAFILKVLMNKY